MTDVVKDFNELYDDIQHQYDLAFYLNCADKNNNTCTLKYLRERKSYFCCAVDNTGRCVLHKSLIVIIGTRLDVMFRADDTSMSDDIKGTFIIDGRHLTFPNVMMNNNILVHNFYDKQYSKSCKRMFLYGNMDEEKKINRAIQLVYDKNADVLFARDVYAKDYIVNENLNETLETYLKSSGKWEPLNFMFDFRKDQVTELFDQIKCIMRADIDYSIDSLANKIMYKHSYLVLLVYRPVLKMYESVLADTASDNEAVPVRRRKTQTVLFPKECKKIVDTIVNGKLIHSVSKTFSKQKKNFMNYQDNSSNNNIEVNPPAMKYRIGNEVVRITNDNMRQDMLMQKKDFMKYVDSFFHGEMTVAGKKFFLCRDVRLPTMNYQLVANKFVHLETKGLIMKNFERTDEHILQLSFNNRPTVYSCRYKDLTRIFYELKHDQCPIELKLTDTTLYVNHHEGMICLKKTVQVDQDVKIITLLTPFEYHHDNSVLRQIKNVEIIENDDVSCLMSKMVQYYYKSYLHIFATTPTPKLIVSLTNLKNAMPVISYDEHQHDTMIDNLPIGNVIVVDPKIRVNNKMFKLWTLIRDFRLKTAEDPYIPDIKLPMRLFNNKVNKLKGKILSAKNETIKIKFEQATRNNCIDVDAGNRLMMVGSVVSSVKIGWVYDGKRYKIEPCKNKTYHVSKIYVYFRKVKNQIVERIDSNMTIHNDTVYLKSILVTSTSDMEGIKICGIHGQKGVLNGSEDLTQWMAEDGTSAQICLSPISYLSRQTNFEKIEKKYVVKGGDFNDTSAKRYVMYNIPYMFFSNTPDNIFKEFIKTNNTGHEKIEGTRLDRWSVNQSFAGNRWTESLQCIRGGNNLPDNSGEYQVVKSLIHCNNTIIA
ncbi:LEF-8 [Operophtera brumata nucleopolyhedrovirus]|uniref:DNA-directed RNA polymerase n=1 Tax=Operophtera brumata nucleopolyhedrovirus TaxID=1046267 RepID=A0A2H4UZR8_9ABAC|nr:LEF-8 [Operophtera brumata nucleopolyhedrovirus]AUA60270.1 LEF-8 [Operophtera brumata nucleopolyhedrovirus]